MGKIKIAIISFDLSGGGAEKHLLNLALYLKERNTDVDIILIKKINDYKKEYKNLIAKIKIIPLLKRSHKISRLYFPLKSIELFIKSFLLFRKNRYQIIIGGLEYYPYYIAVLYSILFRSKCFLIAGNNFTEELKEKFILLRYIHLLLLKLSFFFSYKIICASEGVAFELEKFFSVPKEKISVGYNLLDERIIKSKSNELVNGTYQHVFKNQNVIIAAGRLVSQKGFDTLIKSFYYIKKSIPETKLVILGKGPKGTYLKKLIKELKIQEDVVLLGFVENPYKYFKKSRIFVSTSNFEGLSNVIIEAMVCELPIVSMDCNYGPREILSNKVSYPIKQSAKIELVEYGILVPIIKGESNVKQYDRQAKILSEAIINIFTNRKILLHYKKMSLQRSRDFSIKKIQEKYFNILFN